MEKPGIIISGASGNLGAAVLGKFTSAGYRVAALESHRRDGKQMISELLRSYMVDLGNEQEVEKVAGEIYREFNQLRGAVLTVGGFVPGTIKETGIPDIEKMIRLNFITAYTLIRELTGRMEDDGGGQLVFIGSGPAVDPGSAGGAVAYALAKSLLIRMAEIINATLNAKNIFASVIIPGTIDTPQNRQVMPDADFSGWQSPDEIAARIFSLFTPEGASLRGSVIKI